MGVIENSGPDRSQQRNLESLYQDKRAQYKQHNENQQKKSIRESVPNNLVQR